MLEQYKITRINDVHKAGLAIRTFEQALVSEVPEDAIALSSLQAQEIMRAHNARAIYARSAAGKLIIKLEDTEARLDFRDVTSSLPSGSIVYENITDLDVPSIPADYTVEDIVMQQN